MEYIMTNRIKVLKDRMLSEPRYASIEQAKIITESYKQHENEPRMLQRAWALKAALEKMEIRMEPEELIVGNRTAGVRAGVVFPESGSGWVDREFESLPTRAQDTFQVRQEDIDYFRRVIKPYWAGKSLEDVLKKEHGAGFAAISKVAKINQTDHAQGHICPDCRLWLRKGPAGLKAEAREKAAQNEGDKKIFYESVAMVMDAASHFMIRYGELAEQMAQTDAENAETLRQVAGICRRIAAGPAETFHEALQLLWFLFVILQMESNASSFSPGRLDEILIPYYEADVKAGTLDEGKALELIESLWLKFNQIVYMRNANSAKYFAGFPIGFNIAVGGVDRDGNDYKNDLSFLFLQAQEHLLLPQPNLSVRLHENTSDELLKKAVKVVAKGSGMPQFFNDKAVIPALEALGVSREDARDYAIVGCVELTTQGNNLGWSDAAMFNMNKVLELAMTGGKCLLTGRQLCPDFGSLATYKTFEELEEGFRKIMDYFMDQMVVACGQVEKAHIALLPTPFLSAVIRNCMETGTDVTAGGAKYNFSGIQMIQVANLADSFAALKQLVYDEKRFTPEEVLDALEKNFEGYEIMRAMMLNKVPKYGNDVEWVDALGCKWAVYFKERLNKNYRNYRGGPYHTGMYTVSAHVPMGENVGAAPDGHLAGTPLADGGMSPVYGRDVEGPTAVLKSVSRLDKTLTSNGGLLNMKFLPSFFATQSGIDKFALFLRSFVDLEIPHIQFNVVRREDLLDAQKHPDQYRSLTVRVAGYTAYFTELAGELQNEIIARTAYEDIS
ncbi:MAG: formate C-acetyltransferase/glycerol dehydratase family glycyl radical enzyme [Lachnospiraceae bacterium]|nr:formate C-acetyltransferase/glycerol dehydratase family glycyl radical enzyme [Lachnospiraceae bacterium]